MAKTTTSRSRTTKTRKTSATKKTSSAKSAPKAEPVVVSETAPVVSAPDLKKVELIDAVVERSGVKKRYAKPAVEAALAILGEALAEGQGLNLRPLGKAKVQRSKEVANAKVLTIRVRQAHAKPEGNDDGVADAAE